MTEEGTPGWYPTVEEVLRGGNAEDLRLRVLEIRIGGSIIRPPAAGVTAIVGGNNVGKSTALRDLVALIHREPGNEPVGWHLVHEVVLEKEGDAADLLAWLDRHAEFVARPSQTAGFVRLGHQQPMHPNIASMYWTQGAETRLGQLGTFLVHYADALSRAGMVQGVGQRQDISDPPSHPLHCLQDDPELAKSFSDVSQRIFRRPLTLDRLSANTSLRVGVPSVTAPPVDAVSAEYRESLVRLPLLDQQGDGMKSLLGLLLPVITAQFPIVVIDEPEAFLHPPQAFELGRTLATIAQRQRIQIFLATHDRNLLTGLLDVDGPVTVVRLDREEDRTTAAQLAHEDVRQIWSDPVMRYSNVLDGLFHRLVVVAEADPDCRFYAAALDARDEESSDVLPPSEVHFVPAGGKDGMPKIIRALRALHVRVVASPDLDVLDDAGKVQKLVEAFGGDWSALQADYDASTAGFRNEQTQATCGDVLAVLNEQLSARAGDPWTEDVRDALRPHLRASRSKWHELKRFGVAAFAGQAAARAMSLLDGMDRMGICCVRVGELEQMAPTLAVRKGPAWLPAALDAGAHKASPAQDHLVRVLRAANLDV